MCKRKLTADEMYLFMTTNLQDWKIEAKPILNEIVELNDKLSENDISTIINQDFYEDMWDHNFLSVIDVLDLHFLQEFDYCTNRDVWIALHDIYNR